MISLAELPESAYSHKGWTYHPSAIKVVPSTRAARNPRQYRHWVQSPSGEISLAPFVEFKLIDAISFQKWVGLGSPTKTEIGCLVRTFNQLKEYERRVKMNAIIESLSSQDDPFPEPAAFGAKRFTLRFAKALRRIKEQYDAPNHTLPVLIRLVDSAASRTISNIIGSQTA